MTAAVLPTFYLQLVASSLSPAARSSRLILYLRTMEALMQQIEDYKQEMTAFEATSADAAEAFRIKYLGTKGLVKAVMGEIKNVPNEQKKAFGQILNEFKQFAEARYEIIKESTVNGQPSAVSNIDISLPGTPIAVGTRHPLSIVRNRMVSIFKRLGFAVAEGPEIEDDC